MYAVIVGGGVSDELENTENLSTFFWDTHKIAKSDVNFAMSVCPSVRVKKLGSHWTDFYEILYFKGFFSKTFREYPSFIHEK